jgi:hypothetical protein
MGVDEMADKEGDELRTVLRLVASKTFAAADFSAQPDGVCR